MRHAFVGRGLRDGQAKRLIMHVSFILASCPTIAHLTLVIAMLVRYDLLSKVCKGHLNVFAGHFQETR
jgi:hypothetical protein